MTGSPAVAMYIPTAPAASLASWVDCVHDELVVEGVFEVPGAGGALFRALRQQDRALIVVMIILILSAVIVINALADIAYSVIDPRIRLDDE